MAVTRQEKFRELITINFINGNDVFKEIEMAVTRQDAEEFREFIARDFMNEDGVQDIDEVFDWVAALAIGDNQEKKAAIDRYKAFLEAEEAKLEALIASAEEDKAKALQSFQERKAKKQEAKNKVQN